MALNHMSTLLKTDSAPLPEAKRAPEVRYMLLVDSGTQWFTRMVKQEVETMYHPAKKSGHADARVETVVAEEVTDVPSEVCRTEFLCNIYSRYSTLTYNLRHNNAGSHHGWYISPREYTRIKRMIELNGVRAEFDELAAYSV